MVLWTTWAGVIVALAGAAAAFISLPATRRAADAAKEQTELQRQIAREAAQPRVWVDVRGTKGRRGLVELAVGNSGATPATNVRVVIDPPLPTSDWSEPPQYEEKVAAGVRGQQQLRDGIASIAPGREYRWPLFITPDWPENTDLHHVTIDAEGLYGPVASIEYDIDVEAMRPTLLEDAASGDALKSISATLKQAWLTLEEARRAPHRRS